MRMQSSRDGGSLETVSLYFQHWHYTRKLVGVVKCKEYNGETFVHVPEVMLGLNLVLTNWVGNLTDGLEYSAIKGTSNANPCLVPCTLVTFRCVRSYKLQAHHCSHHWMKLQDYFGNIISHFDWTGISASVLSHHNALWVSTNCATGYVSCASEGGEFSGATG